MKPTYGGHRRIPPDGLHQQIVDGERVVTPVPRPPRVFRGLRSAWPRSRRPWNVVLLVSALAAGCATVPRTGWEEGLHRAIADRTASFAAADGLLAGFAPLAPDAPLAAGDQVLFGVCLEDGDERRIWYLRVRVVGVERRRWFDAREVHAFEQRVRRENPLGRGPDPGGADRRAAFVERRIDLEGPFDLEDLFDDVDVAQIRVEAFDAAGRLVDAAESQAIEWRLRQGLLPACAAGDRLRNVMAGRVAAGLDAETIVLAGADHDAVHVVGDGVTSCERFLLMLRENPVTRGILEEVIELPSLWSILRRFGVRAELSIDFFAARRIEPWRYPGSDRTLWGVPVTLLLNDEPALFACLLAGPAGAPDGASAGVFGVVGRSPSDPDRRVFVQLLASRRGGDTAVGHRGRDGTTGSERLDALPASSERRSPARH